MPLDVCRSCVDTGLWEGLWSSLRCAYRHTTSQKMNKILMQEIAHRYDMIDNFSVEVSVSSGHQVVLLIRPWSIVISRTALCGYFQIFVVHTLVTQLRQGIGTTLLLRRVLYILMMHACSHAPTDRRGDAVSTLVGQRSS